MKQFKLDVIKEMENKVKDNREISLRECANAIGIKHIKTNDCREILLKFCKSHPEYKPVHFTDRGSLFCGGVVTEFEYEEVIA